MWDADISFFVSTEIMYSKCLIFLDIQFTNCPKRIMKIVQLPLKNIR